jgi:heme-degrading monooxygenase HmoA
MFGRQVTIKLKANSATELTRINDKEILPLLRQHKGFRDETVFVSPERSEAIVNTCWDSQEDAEAYSRTGYAEVMKKISNLVEGTPTIKTFEFASSSFHQTAAAKAA